MRPDAYDVSIPLYAELTPPPPPKPVAAEDKEAPGVIVIDLFGDEDDS